jgi:hypothetical protein
LSWFSIIMPFPSISSSFLSHIISFLFIILLLLLLFHHILILFNLSFSCLLSFNFRFQNS